MWLQPKHAGFVVPAWLRDVELAMHAAQMQRRAALGAAGPGPQRMRVG